VDEAVFDIRPVVLGVAAHLVETDTLSLQLLFDSAEVRRHRLLKGVR
jgi:hypothetical protein